MKKLFAIVSDRTNDYIWAGVTHPTTAETVALDCTLRHGSIRLLSDKELIAYLIERELTTK